MPTNAQSQLKIKKTKSKFYESITFTEPQDYSETVGRVLALFELQQFNNEIYLKHLEKLNILKKNVDGNYWFIVPLQEDFGDQPCYIIQDTSLYWFGGQKPFGWSKDGKTKLEAEVIVWAQYLITPDKGIIEVNSNILDNTGITHIDMKTFYSGLKGAHLPFEDRKKPKLSARAIR